MSNTVNIHVNQSEGWKEVITGPSKGTFSVGQGIQFCQLDTLPDLGFVGHRANGFIVGFNTPDGFSVYVKADNNVATVVLTQEV